MLCALGSYRLPHVWCKSFFQGYYWGFYVRYGEEFVYFNTNSESAKKWKTKRGAENALASFDMRFPPQFLFEVEEVEYEAA